MHSDAWVLRRALTLAEEEPSVGHALCDIAINENLIEYALNPEDAKCCAGCNRYIWDVQYSLIHALVIEASKYIADIYEWTKHYVSEVSCVAAQRLETVWN